MIRYTVLKESGGCKVVREEKGTASAYDELMALLMIIQSAYKDVLINDRSQGTSLKLAMKKAVSNDKFWEHAEEKETIIQN